jgi:hypothetical protein
VAAIRRVAVRPQDRGAYLQALETGSVSGDLEPFRQLMSRRLAETLAGYVEILKESGG